MAAIKFKPLEWSEANTISDPKYSIPPTYQARVYLGSVILVYDLIRLAKDDYRYSVFFGETKCVDKDFVTNRISDFSFSDIEDAKRHADCHYQEYMYTALLALEHYELKELLNNES